MKWFWEPVLPPEPLKSPSGLHQHLPSCPATHQPASIHSLHLGSRSGPRTKKGRNHRVIALEVSLRWASRKFQLLHSLGLVKLLKWNGCLERSRPSRLRLDFRGWGRSDKDEWRSKSALKVKALWVTNRWQVRVRAKKLAPKKESLN